eukprot:364774-Chlamydomonas_euryale.AAC.22
MADAVAEPQVEEPSAAPREEGRERRPPPNWDEPLPPYDDSLLVKVKGKVKRPSKPDDTERNTAVEELQAEIKRRSERIAEIKGVLQGRRNRTADPVAEAHKRNKAALRGEWDAVLVSMRRHAARERVGGTTVADDLVPPQTCPTSCLLAGLLHVAEAKDAAQGRPRSL